MGTNDLKIKVVSLDDAPDYDKSEWVGLDLTDALVVKEGTVEGNPTVDLKLKDKDGNQYIAMVTGAILQSLASVIEGAVPRG